MTKHRNQDYFHVQCFEKLVDPSAHSILCRICTEVWTNTNGDYILDRGAYLLVTEWVSRHSPRGYGKSSVINQYGGSNTPGPQPCQTGNSSETQTMALQRFSNESAAEPATSDGSREKDYPSGETNEHSVGNTNVKSNSQSNGQANIDDQNEGDTKVNGRIDGQAYLNTLEPADNKKRNAPLTLDPTAEQPKRTRTAQKSDDVLFAGTEAIRGSNESTQGNAQQVAQDNNNLQTKSKRSRRIPYPIASIESEPEDHDMATSSTKGEQKPWRLFDHLVEDINDRHSLSKTLQSWKEAKVYTHSQSYPPLLHLPHIFPIHLQSPAI